MSHELPEPGFPHASDVVRLWGDDGLLEADHLGKLRIATDGKWRDVWEMPQFDYIGADFGADRLEAFHRQTQDFVDCLRDGRPPAVTGEDGRAARSRCRCPGLGVVFSSTARRYPGKGFLEPDRPPNHAGLIPQRRATRGELSLTPVRGSAYRHGEVATY